VGPPPTENGLVGAVIWDLLSVYIRRKLPHILRIMCPAETAYLPVLILQVEEARNHNEWAERKNTILSDSDLKRAHTLVLVDDNTDVTNFMSLYWHCMNMGQDSFSISDSGIRVVDGVLWKYQGKRKVRTP
jgi:UbiD family decarboxylase